MCSVERPRYDVRSIPRSVSTQMAQGLHRPQPGRRSDCSPHFGAVSRRDASGYTSSLRRFFTLERAVKLICDKFDCEAMSAVGPNLSARPGVNRYGPRCDGASLRRDEEWEDADDVPFRAKAKRKQGYHGS
jgi:hypothetical protein